MWKFLIKLAFLLYYTRHQGFSFVSFNQVAFRCVDIKETLQMICTVQDPGLGAYIFHNNKENAHCVSFPIISCTSFTQGNISFTVSNDTVFTIESREKNSLNGTWTCRNGIGDRNENASIEIVSTQCQSSSVLWKGGIKKSNTEVKLLLIVVPIVVIVVTIICLRCCNIREQNVRNQRIVRLRSNNLINWLLENIGCLWKYCFTGQNGYTRTVWQFVYCFVLCCMYLPAVLAVFYIKMRTDLEIGLIIFCCVLGIFVFSLIPIIWNAGDAIDINDVPNEQAIEEFPMNDP